MSNETHCALSLHGILHGSMLTKFLNILRDIPEVSISEETDFLDALLQGRSETGYMLLYFHDVDEGAMDESLRDFLISSDLTWSWSKGPDDEYGRTLDYKMQGDKTVYHFALDKKYEPCVNLDEAFESGDIAAYIKHLKSVWQHYQNNTSGFFVGRSAHEAFEDQAKFSQ